MGCSTGGFTEQRYSAKRFTACLHSSPAATSEARKLARAWLQMSLPNSSFSLEGVSSVFFDCVLPAIVIGQVAAVLIVGSSALLIFLLSQACGAFICGVLFVITTPSVMVMNHVTSAVAVYCGSLVLSRIVVRHPKEWNVRSLVADCSGAAVGALWSLLFSRFAGAGQAFPVGIILAIGLIRSASETVLPNPRSVCVNTHCAFVLFLDSLLLFLLSTSLQAAVRSFLDVLLSYLENTNFPGDVLRGFLSAFAYSIRDCFLMPFASAKFSKLALRRLSSAVKYPHAAPSATSEPLTYSDCLVGDKRDYVHISREKGQCDSHKRRARAVFWHFHRRRNGTGLWRRSHGGLSVNISKVCLSAYRSRKKLSHKSALCCSIPSSQIYLLQDAEEGGKMATNASDEEPRLPSCLVQALQDSFSCSVKRSTAALHGTLRPFFELLDSNTGNVESSTDEVVFCRNFEESLLASLSSAITSPDYLSHPSPQVLFGTLSCAFSASFFCSLSISFSSRFCEFLPNLGISAAVIEGRGLAHLFVSTFCSTVWGGTLEAARQQMAVPLQFSAAVRQSVFFYRTGAVSRWCRVFTCWSDLPYRTWIVLVSIPGLDGGRLIFCSVRSQQSTAGVPSGAICVVSLNEGNTPYNNPA